MKPDLDEMLELLSQTDPGPWEADIDDPGSKHPEFTGKFYSGEDSGTWDTYGDPREPYNKNQIANIRFCALARTWVPQLIEEIQRLRREDTE
jgi:hypothetical protein